MIINDFVARVEHVVVVFKNLASVSFNGVVLANVVDVVPR